jgi:3',5'-cyclic AMP phosphodiesterase CpdA
VGDLAYDHGTTLDVLEKFTVPFAPTMARTPLYAVLGNHDVDTENGKPFLDAVVLPTNPVDGTEHFYSFDWGPCHCAALDSNADLSVGSPQRTWLDADLSASPARWKFVLLHHPLWSSSSHGSSPALQASLSPVLEAHEVDVVFSGHDHDYERTFPLVGPTPANAGQEPDYASPPGPVYVVTGGGGKGLYPAGAGTFTAFSESAFHVTVVDVLGPTLTITAVRLDGTVMDRASITK